MARTAIQVVRAVPSSAYIGPILDRFCQKPDGVVTAFSDAALPLVRRFVDDDHPVEVMPFGEVVLRILRLCGEEARDLAKSGHVLAALAKTCGDLPIESPFAKTARFPGLHQALSRTLKELHEWGIDEEEMLRLADRASPRLAEKLRSLAEIDHAVIETLRDLGCESHAAHLRACLECTPERDGGFDRLLVLAGSEDSPLRVQWLKWLARQGTQVTVVVDRHATEAKLFKGAERIATALAGKVVSPGDGNRLTRNLFAETDMGGSGIDVEIVSAADPMAEVEWALRGCLEVERVDQAAIYVRDLESYAPLIEAASRRLEIPVQMARRGPLLANSFARLTMSALEFCAGNDVRALRPILCSSYLGLSGETQNVLGSVLKAAHTARGRQWDYLREWATSEDGQKASWMAILLEWRLKAVGERYPLREWRTMLHDLIDHRELPWSIHREKNEGRMTERDRRARNQMQRLLANHVSIDAATEETSATLGEMVQLCRQIWGDADVSIPSEGFGVLVTDQVDALTDADRLHVLGMLEGVFPRRRSEEPILTDRERREISELRPDQPRLLTSHDRAEAERDAFYRVVVNARQRLVCSYPQADDQRDNIPAFYLTEVEAAARPRPQPSLLEPTVGHVVRRDIPRRLLAPDSVEACVIPADRALREALAAERQYALDVKLQSDVARHALSAPENARYGPNELRDVLQCPFQYVVRHRVRVPVRRSRTRWQSLRKIPQVANLSGHETMEAAEAALILALDTELDMLYSDVEEWEMQLLRAGGRRLIRDWVQRESLARAIWTKEAGSVRTQATFGSEGLRANMPGDVVIQGHVAAVSRLQNYTVAHLYGSPPREPKKMSEEEKLYFGLHFLALHQPGLESALEIDAMSGKRELLVLSRSGGSLTSRNDEGLKVVDLSTCDDAAISKKAFYDEVKASLRRAMQRIAEVSIEPIRGDHCEWCDYGELCRRSRLFGEEDSPFGVDVAGADHE